MQTCSTAVHRRGARRHRHLSRRSLHRHAAVCRRTAAEAHEGGGQRAREAPGARARAAHRRAHEPALRAQGLHEADRRSLQPVVLARHRAGQGADAARGLPRQFRRNGLSVLPPGRAHRHPGRRRVLHLRDRRLRLAASRSSSARSSPPPTSASRRRNSTSPTRSPSARNPSRAPFPTRWTCFSSASNRACRSSTPSARSATRSASSPCRSPRS